MELKTFYIGFYRFLDTKVWQRTQVEPVETKLKAYLETVDYIDKNSIKIVSVQLPE